MPLGQTELANTHTAGQSHGASVVTMLAHRLRRWQTFGQSCRIGPTIISGALPSKHDTLTQCCFIAGPTSQTASQNSNNIGS